MLFNSIQARQQSLHTYTHTQTFELNRSNNRDPRRVFFAHVSTDVFSAAGGAKNNGPKYFSNPASLERTTKRNLPTLPPCNKRQSVEARIYASRPSEAGERTKQPFSRMLISDRRRSSCDTRYFPQLNPNIKGGRERKNCPSAHADIIACVSGKHLLQARQKFFFSLYSIIPALSYYYQKPLEFPKQKFEGNNNRPDDVKARIISSSSLLGSALSMSKGHLNGGGERKEGGIQQRIGPINLY